MGEIFSAAGNVAGAAISANAAEKAAKMQIDALKKQRDFVFDQLSPEKIGGAATAQDTQRAKDRLALQQIVDPALLQTRYAAQNELLKQVQGIGSGEEDALASMAASEAAAGSPGLQELKNRLIDSALSELELGASLPPDLQSELVKAGLERGATVTGGTDPSGLTGTATRKLIGERGIQLQADRQGRAAQLATTAQNLDTARASVLGNLFPSIAALKTQNQARATSAFQTANAAVPEAGLGGSDIANIWLARVGATNQLAQSAADAAARGATAQGQAYGNLAGSLGRLGSAIIPSSQGVYDRIMGVGQGSDSFASSVLGMV